MQDCVFCKIINKEATADILFENMICLVFVPLNPITKGHVLIVPKTHYQDIFDIDIDILLEITSVAQKIARNLIKERGATGINLLHASGKDAQQSVFHFHLHHSYFIARVSEDVSAGGCKEGYRAARAEA